jgi:hypothetical protein
MILRCRQAENRFRNRKAKLTSGRLNVGNQVRPDGKTSGKNDGAGQRRLPSQVGGSAVGCRKRESWEEKISVEDNDPRWRGRVHWLRRRWWPTDRRSIYDSDIPAINMRCHATTMSSSSAVQKTLKASCLTTHRLLYFFFFENFVPERESRRPIPGVAARYSPSADVRRWICAGRRVYTALNRRRKPLRARPQHFGA